MKESGTRWYDIVYYKTKWKIISQSYKLNEVKNLIICASLIRTITNKFNCFKKICLIDQIIAQT